MSLNTDAKKRFRPLTSLRGAFACWVMILHIFIVNLRDVVVAPWAILRGYLAVDFFFFLSGIRCWRQIYAPKFLGPFSGAKYLQFVIRRWGRLFPLHIVIVLAIVAIHPVYPFRYVVEELTLTQRWHIWPPADSDWINLPSWSISTEWAASLLFPLFVWGALKGSGAFAPRLSAVAAAALVRFTPPPNINGI